MKLPFKPHLLVLLCSAGLFAASGVMFVKSRATEPAAPAPVAQQPLHRIDVQVRHGGREPGEDTDER